MTYKVAGLEVPAFAATSSLLTKALALLEEIKQRSGYEKQ